MANETQFDGQYNGLGLAASVADSGDQVFSASPATVTATFAQVAGQQPQVTRGKIYVEVKGLNAAAVLGAIDITASDGTNVEYLDAVGAPASAVAGRGMSNVIEFFTARSLLTNVVSISARIVTTTNNNGTARLRVLGGP